MSTEDDSSNVTVMNRFENTVLNNNIIGMKVFIYTVAIQCILFTVNNSILVTSKIPEYQLFFPTVAVLALCLAGALGKSVI